MTLHPIIVIAGVFDFNFLYDIIYLGEFTLAPNLRYSFLIQILVSVNASNTVFQKSVVRRICHRQYDIDRP